MFQRILLALDHSTSSHEIFDRAVALAQTCNAKLLLLHVLCPLDQGYPAIPLLPGLDTYYPLMHDEAVKQYVHQLAHFEQESLEKLRQWHRLATEAGVAAEFSQNLGSPGPTICSVARTWEADLVVVGRRGHTGLNELLVGSVSNYVTHHAPCSVLTIQGPPWVAPAVEQTVEQVAVG